MRAYQLLCYLCYDSGDEVPATHQYTTSSGEKVDICEKHIGLCKAEKLEVTKLDLEEMIKESY